MKEGNERKSSPFECDVGLGLKVQAESSTSERAAMAAFPFYHYQFDSSGKDANVVNLGGAVGGSLLFNTSGGRMAVSGASVFTASQWQELERQKMIHKYMMASVPVPPELILPISTTPSSHPNISSGLDSSKFCSSRLDPEPWRCKRTDGKKWRCSRDVAPDQKYCERHAHKNRPRSRKPPLELSSTNLAPQRSTSQLPSMTPSHDQTRCVEWFMRGGSSSSSGAIPASTCSQQQWQQVMQRLELMNKDNTTKNMSLFQTQENQDFMNLKTHFSGSDLDSKFQSLQRDMPLNPGTTQTTRHFIDAWEKEALSSKGSSLTLSMSGLNGMDDDVENRRFGITTDRDSEGILRPTQWMNNPVSWINSPPGGPLGEALCLGSTSISRGGSSNLASPHGYCNSNTNTNSSKSSCEDDSHALNFIG